MSINSGMHIEVYELICFELGVMIDCIEFYILILVFGTLTFIKGHRCNKLLSQLYLKVLNRYE